ncbi:MAG: SUMF1/EgtB/PvdO family nonheme iron enzyme [Polyangiales bacterium]
MIRRSRAVFTLGALVALVVGSVSCRKSASDGATAGAPAGAPEGAASVQVAIGKGRRTEEIARVHEKIEVPAGRFYAGSLPGDEGRDPTLEPVSAAYDLAPFSIDALPYPNEPGLPPLTAVTSAEAAKLCEARGQRLCTELEWERACRGPNGDAFSAGPSWDPSCSQSEGECVSGFGVRMMGATLEEWTSSAVEASAPKGLPRVSVKGAYATATPAAHRCAARHAFDPAGGNKNVGFRCCEGGSPDAKMASIEAPATFRKTTLSPAALTAIFAQLPELARLRNAPHPFRDSDVATVTEKAKSPPDGVTLTVDPIVWSPVPGEQLLVATGKSKGGAFVVALHMLPDHKFRVASSMIFASEQGPIVLAYQGNLKKEILWSMCWGCAGEGGAVTYRDDHRVVIVQR